MRLVQGTRGGKLTARRPKVRRCSQTPRQISHRRMDRMKTHRYSLSVTTPTVDYSGKAEWILDTGATYHVCSNKA